MDSNSVNSPDLHMPPPSVGQDGLPDPEQGNGLTPQPNFSDASDTVLVNPHDPQVTPQAAAPSALVRDDNGVTGADDDDALDEEWIQKAKTIVDQTRADPYQQSREISKVKASYLKTHYNKDIKVADDQSL